jgi:hypothetical protein
LISTSVLLAGTVAHAASVNIELTLLVDVSSSIDSTEYTRQRIGYRNAFQNLNFEAFVGAGNSVAVNYIEWSGINSQSVRSVNAGHLDGWWLLTSQADCNAFAAHLNTLTHIEGGTTAPQNALNFAISNSGGGMFNNSYTSDRQIIDVSGDGPSNSGLGGTVGRDAAIAAGVDQINGLVIGNEGNVLDYYLSSIQAGNGSFTLQANSFDVFSKAILDKLRIELGQGVPLPGTAAMGFLGLGLVATARRRGRI